MNSQINIFAELSSISSQIDDLIIRIEKVIETNSAERTDENSGFLEAERHLSSARRELNRMLRNS